MGENSEDVLYIIIPAYNEQDTIASVIDDWYSVVLLHNGNGQSRLVILDDGSCDHTYEIMKRMAKTRPLFLPIRKKNQGHGPTVRAGYGYAIRKGADFIFQTDSDGQTLPSEFEAFYSLRHKYDMVIGDRSKREDGFSRLVVSEVLRLVLALAFHVRTGDANTPFRLMKADTLMEELKFVPKSCFLSNAVLTALFTKEGRKIKYLPITFRKRQGGVNSINLKKISKIGIQALREFRKINRRVEESLR